MASALIQPSIIHDAPATRDVIPTYLLHGPVLANPTFTTQKPTTISVEPSPPNLVSFDKPDPGDNTPPKKTPFQVDGQDKKEKKVKRKRKKNGVNATSAEKSRQPGRQSTFTQEQQLFLASLVQGNWDPVTSNKAESKAFYELAVTQWIDKYGHNSLAPQFSDDAVGKDYGRDISKVDMAKQIQINLARDACREIIHDKLTPWYRRNYKQRDNQANSPDAVMSAVLQTINRLNNRPPRRLSVKQVYHDMYNDKLSTGIQEITQSAPAKDRLQLIQQFISSSWDNESVFVRQEVIKRVEQIHNAEMQLYHQRLNWEAQPEFYNTAKQKIKNYLPAVTNGVAKYLGGLAFMVVVYPDGDDGGNIKATIVQSDTAPGRIKAAWADLSRPAFDAFLDSVVSYGRAWFTPEECQRRVQAALKEKEEAEETIKNHLHKSDENAQDHCGADNEEVSQPVSVTPSSTDQSSSSASILAQKDTIPFTQVDDAHVVSDNSPQPSSGAAVAVSLIPAHLDSDNSASCHHESTPELLVDSSFDQSAQNILELSQLTDNTNIPSGADQSLEPVSNDLIQEALKYEIDLWAQDPTYGNEDHSGEDFFSTYRQSLDTLAQPNDPHVPLFASPFPFSSAPSHSMTDLLNKPLESDDFSVPPSQQCYEANHVKRLQEAAEGSLDPFHKAWASQMLQNLRCQIQQLSHNPFFGDMIRSSYTDEHSRSPLAQERTTAQDVHADITPATRNNFAPRPTVVRDLPMKVAEQVNNIKLSPVSSISPSLARAPLGARTTPVASTLAHALTPSVASSVNLGLGRSNIPNLHTAISPTASIMPLIPNSSTLVTPSIVTPAPTEFEHFGINSMIQTVVPSNISATNIPTQETVTPITVTPPSIAELDSSTACDIPTSTGASPFAITPPTVLAFNTTSTAHDDGTTISPLASINIASRPTPSDISFSQNGISSSVTNPTAPSLQVAHSSPFISIPLEPSPPVEKSVPRAKPRKSGRQTRPKGTPKEKGETQSIALSSSKKKGWKGYVLVAVDENTPPDTSATIPAKRLSEDGPMDGRPKRQRVGNKR